MNTYDSLIFNQEGPLMSGTWYNPNNGDSFTVADCFFQDDKYFVKTTDNRILDYNFIQNYIKSDKPLNIQNNIQKPQPSSKKLPAEVLNILDTPTQHTPTTQNIDGILPEDLNIISKTNSLGNINQPVPNNNDNSHINMMISKALSKKHIPLLDIKISWPEFPLKEIGLLVEVMEIDIDSIIQWYVKQFDINRIKTGLSNELYKYVKNSIEVQSDSDVNNVIDSKDQDNKGQGNKDQGNNESDTTKKAAKKSKKSKK